MAALTGVEVKIIALQRVLALHQFLNAEVDADHQLDAEALFVRVIEFMYAACADRKCNSNSPAPERAPRWGAVSFR